MGYLTNDVFVCESYNEAIFRGVVLVFVLSKQPFSSVVIGLAFTSSLEFDLETFEVSTVLDDFAETHHDQDNVVLQCVSVLVDRS